jgi:DNA-3-methyladenine glycosylase I
MGKRPITTPLSRCTWATGEQIEYHDTEWGVPVHNDQVLFEFLILEGAQGGLSWSTILKKRAGYRKAFDQFDPNLVAKFDAAKIEELVADPGIVRHRQKIESAVHNAKTFLKVQEEFETFDKFIWTFVGGQPKQNALTSLSQIPAITAESNAMSRELKKRGFKFVGSTTCYAFMQAVGMVNDHIVDCFRHLEVQKKKKKKKASVGRLPNGEVDSANENCPATTR